MNDITKKHIEDALSGSIEIAELEKLKAEQKEKEWQESKEEFLYFCELALAPFNIKRRKK